MSDDDVSEVPSPDMNLDDGSYQVAVVVISDVMTMDDGERELRVVTMNDTPPWVVIGMLTAALADQKAAWTGSLRIEGELE